MRRVTFGMTVPSVIKPTMQVALSRFLEAVGFDRLWFPDHMSYPDFAPCTDPWSVIASVAATTSRIGLGTAVSDPHRLHPAVFAQRLATIDQLSRGRVVLGLGSGEAMNLAQFGIPWDRRLGRMREAIRVMRGLLDSAEPFTFQGEFFQLRNARLTVHPYQRRHLPIFMSALGPTTQKIAGEHADGWFPLVMPPQFYNEYFAPLGAAAVAAGRDANAIERVAMLPLALVDESKVSPRQIEEMVRPHALLLVWPPVVRRLGLRFDPPDHLKDIDYVTLDPTDADSMDKYNELQAWIPADLFPHFLFYGSVFKIRKAIAAYLDAGATHIDILNISPDPLQSTLTLATEVLPYFTRRRAPLAAHLAEVALPIARRLGWRPRLTDPGTNERKLKLRQD